MWHGSQLGGAGGLSPRTVGWSVPCHHPSSVFTVKRSVSEEHFERVGINDALARRVTRVSGSTHGLLEEKQVQLLSQSHRSR
jgi:hypothetical protein